MESHQLVNEPTGEKMDEDGHRIIYESGFDEDLYSKYKFWSTSSLCAVFTCCVPLWPFVAFAIPTFKREAREAHVILTDEHLKYTSNSYCFCPPFCFDPCLILTKTNAKIVSLEKITNVSLSEDFIQRQVGVETVSVEIPIRLIVKDSKGNEREIRSEQMTLCALKESQEFYKALTDAKKKISKKETTNLIHSLNQQSSGGQGVDNSTTQLSEVELNQIQSTFSRIENVVKSLHSVSNEYQRIKQ